MERDISFGFIWKSLKKSWVYMVAAAIVVASLAGVFASFLPKTYSSSVTFYTRNQKVSEDVVNQSSLSATGQLIDDYIKLITEGDSVLSKVSLDMKETYGVTISPAAISSMLSSSSNENSSIFKIKVSSRDPELAYMVATSISKVAPLAVTEIAKQGYLTTEYISSQVAEVVRRLGKIEGLYWDLETPQNYDQMIQGYINEVAASDPAAAAITTKQVKSILNLIQEEESFRYVLDEPENFEELVYQYLNENTSLLQDISLCFTPVKEPVLDKTHDSPNIPSFIIIGGVAAAVVAFLIFFLKDLFDNSISSEDDVKRLINRPVIGAVPRWGSTSKK